MPDGSSPRTNIGVSLLLVVICAAVLWETRKIPPGIYEPLGSAPVPQMVTWLIIVLSLLVIGRACVALLRSEGAAAGEADEELRPVDAAMTFVLTLAYVAAMHFRLLDFAILTSIFLFASIGFLVGFRTRTLPLIAAVAVMVGFGTQYIFTRVFIVDLPGL